MTIPQAPSSARYAKVIDVSKRVRWEIDRDLIRGRHFDYGKTFLPSGLSLVDELLEGVREKMKAYRSVDNVDYLFKDSAAKPAPAALYDEITKKYKGAIVALAD